MAYRDKPSTMDRLIAKNPPRITWRKNSHGIWVHTSIRDPQADVGNTPRTSRKKKPREKPTEPTTGNARLMNAARTEI